MGAGIPDGLTDPLGVAVELIAGAEPMLDRARIAEVAAAVAGGRAKRRRLVQALLARPAVLTDGRSPAPRVVGNLLIALRESGAQRISAPVCAACGKALRSLQRRGDDWYCSVCGCQREPCAACGQTRSVTFRDRAGGPRCIRCPPGDGRDPMDIVVDVVTGIDPTLSAEVVLGVVNATVSQAGQRNRLAWALADRPDLLTGGGAQAPVPSVLRLIEALCDAGATRVIRPACPHCQRVMPLHRPIHGRWLCRNCVAKSRAQPCSRCGALREAATRDEHGRPLCPNCLIRHPANLEVCLNCGRRRIVSSRTPEGPLCPSCPPLPMTTCSICGQQRGCGTSRLTGLPWCAPCQHRSQRCIRCGQVAPISSGTLHEPLCRGCTVPRFPDCSACDASPRPGQCPPCRLQLRIRELMSGPDGVIHPSLQPLQQALAATDPPETALQWLAKRPVANVLTDIACGRWQLTHALLDELPQRASLAHLRSVLVATGTLPSRDEQMARLERFIDEAVATRTDPEQRQILHRYALWHLLRRLRRRNNGRATTDQQYKVVHQHVRAAAVVLDWLTDQQLTLTTCGQGHLDQWLASDQASHRDQAGHFIRWAAAERLTALSLPATRWQGPTRALDDQARWQAARRLLHDNTLNARDRVAGLLVLLYAQPVARISRLTTSQITVDDGTVRLHLGSAPITLPDPVAELTRQLLMGNRGHATTGAGRRSPWLFPGGQPGRPINASHLGKRLNDLGIQPGQARSTALFQLATELPAALLARMLGIHISVAVTWQRASSGDWTNYAAQLSRRQERSTDTPQGAHLAPG